MSALVETKTEEKKTVTLAKGAPGGHHQLGR